MLFTKNHLTEFAPTALSSVYNMIHADDISTSDKLLLYAMNVSWIRGRLTKEEFLNVLNNFEKMIPSSASLGMFKHYAENAAYDEFTSSNTNLPAYNEDGFSTYKYSVLASLNLLIYDVWDTDSKVVYKFDDTFASCFKDTKKLRIYPCDLIHLPHGLFYIDMSALNIGQQAELDGVCVFVHPSADKIFIYINYITDSKKYYSFQSPHVITIFFEDCKYINGVMYYDYEKEYANGKIITMKDKFAKDTSKEKDSILMLVLNFLSYITCKKPDIVESKLTKKHAQRSQRLCKPYTGPIEYEVGYRYGKAISIYTEKQNREYDEHHQLNGDRHSPRPHLVSAHWHGYWYGKNNSEFEYIWLAPYFKGKGPIDVVIHDCISVDKPKCSHGEQMLHFLLDQHKIPYEKQYYIPETGKYFDVCAHINNKKVFIEFDGEQHFRNVRNWDYEKTVISDNEKNAYCREHNIPLCRIRYDQFLNINDVLDKLKENVDYYKTRLNYVLSDEDYYCIRKPFV